MFFKYPYTDLYNLNLDWIIKVIKDMQEIVEPLDRVVNSVNGMTGDVTLTRDLLMQILGGLVTKFNGRDGDVELTADDVNATLIDITWTSDPGETVADLTQTQLDAMFASGYRILIFVNNLGVADQVYFLQWYDNHAQPQEYTPTSALAGVVSFNGATGNVVVTGDDLETSGTDNKTIAQSLAEKVPQTRTINNIPLSANVSIGADDVPSQAITGATNVEMALGNLNASKVPNARTVNGKSLLNDVVLNDEDIPSSVDGKTDVEEVLTYQSEEIADLTEETEAVTENKADIILSSASGSIATFDDGADGLPVESLKVAIEPVQAGSGDPSPDNVRPITGWTGVKVTRTGKNLIDYMSCTGIGPRNGTESIYPEAPSSFSGNILTIDMAYGSNGGILKGVQHPSFAADTSFVISFEAKCTGTDITVGYGKYEGGGTNTIETVRVTANTWTTITKVFTSQGDSIGLFIQPTANNTVLEIRNLQLELGSTATAYAPYQGEIYDITFPTEAGTVYGGTLNTATGELVVDRAMKVFRGDNSEGWAKETGYNYFSSTKITGAVDRNAQASDFQSNLFAYASISNGSSALGACLIWAAVRVRLADMSISLGEWKAQLATTPMQVVYPLANPITYTLTPAEITTLLGVNNVWADTGDVEISYRADTKLYIDQQTAELGPVNDLTSSSTTAALAAAQGKALKALIDGGKWTTVKQTGYFTSQTSLFYTGVSVTIPANSVYVLLGQTIFNDTAPSLACFSISSNPTQGYNIVNKPADGCSKTAICGITGATDETFYLLGVYTDAAQNSGVISGAYAALN